MKGRSGEPRSGEQWSIAYGEQRAVIAGVGASLRGYRAGGRDLVVPFGADELRPAFRGVTVAPWPNRVVDGSFTWNGERLQLPLTEPSRGHALHGCTPWLRFAGERQGPHAVVLRAVIEPQAGYPWRIAVETRYALGPLGLTQEVVGTNLSPEAAPYGVCPHPYLVAGAGGVDDWTLRLPASRVLLVDEHRLVPESLAEVSVDPERFDFREPRRIGEARIDHAFTQLERGEDGRARAELRAPDGGGVAMSWGPECAWLQIHTADLADSGAHGHRAGLAVEPMSCGPDAFNHGTERNLVELAPGEAHRAEWRIEALDAS
ncbi:aldose 1-epimerase family protein [Leucobacter massiliensis]|uniref:Galactose mutarotase n=1 Tax=Leucobacter massiliensis TaxID=1686285 RepID=A0A2S9QRT5_9MICO|nr:aldose 1-epimerase family protein [Leucobacter massiliensis]PRI12301.1 hypothetical protein B4915_01050 [Leucobacter massiliensis]